MLPIFPRGVLDEILNLVELVSFLLLKYIGPRVQEKYAFFKHIVDAGRHMTHGRHWPITTAQHEQESNEESKTKKTTKQKKTKNKKPPQPPPPKKNKNGSKLPSKTHPRHLKKMIKKQGCSFTIFVKAERYST